MRVQVRVRVRVHVRVLVRVRVYKCRNAKLSGIRLVQYQTENLMMPGLVQYRNKPRQSGIFLIRYWTGIIDAGMPMPALVSSMSMPSYGDESEVAHL